MTESLITPVVSIILEHPLFPDRILLQKRTKPEKPGLNDLFELPQGRVRAGETVISCAQRELLEETGLFNFRLRNEPSELNVRGERLSSLRAITVSENGQHSYMAICLIGTADGNPKSSDESSDPCWYSKEEVMNFISRELVFPLNVPMLLSYYSNL